MLIELHLLQNFAPSNLNRDDTGAPKDCTFGGKRRARISSQCIKRNIRRHDAFISTVQAHQGDVGVRTQRLLERIVQELVQRNPSRSEDDAKRVGTNLLSAVRLKVEQDGSTQYLLYLGRKEIDALIEIGHRRWDDLVNIKPSGEPGSTGGQREKRREKSAAQEAIPKDIQKEVANVFGSTCAADIALFGRMVADQKNMGVNAACQVAHALSTHEIAMEMDYYTAVDDLRPDETPGADMIGQVEFNSACYYRYANINLNLLKANLGDDAQLAKGATLGFIKAAALATPTGKQNSMAARNLPSYIRVLVRRGGEPWSLANAFLKPVRATADKDIVESSIEKLTEHLEQLKRVYGDNIIGDYVASLTDPATDSLEDLLSKVEQHLPAAGGNQP